jgi:hypothetical protein
MESENELTLMDISKLSIKELHNQIIKSIRNNFDVKSQFRMSRLISLEFAKKLKDIGITQYSKNVYSNEKQLIVNNANNFYFASKEDISVFDEFELFDIIESLIKH